MEAASTESLKSIIKEALVEVLQERGDLISDAVEEALEDARLLRAMEGAREEGFEDPKQVASLRGLQL
jgi:hypothetical protein